ncbi:hypothetical protein [Aquabacterium sp. A08]|uniref:hypothetical protein n=1 Tax=Aquabacterium sp. A08 TaxID=2718532 RepID=UPI00141F9A19|nr:hypothetical protein [Aquabacterium sp. A08]NIC42757.1 hypothetical protein [Aquabacterium sp. A08]
MFKLAVGGTWLVTAVQGWALSLGAVQGQVIIGRPLDILVQSSVDASEAASGLCLEATVLYGDARVPSQAVSATVHRVGGEGVGALRVRASEPVTEPIVTVVLRAGCPQTFRRSYALLADVEVAPATAAAVASPVAAAPVRRPPEPPATSGAVLDTPRAPASPPVAPRAPAPARAAPAAMPSPAPATAPVARAEPETPVRLSAPAARPAGVVRLKTKQRPPVPVAQAVADGAPAAPSPLQSALPPDTAGPRLKLDPLDLSPSGAPVAPVGETAPAPGEAPSAAASADVAPSAEPNAPDVAAVAQELDTLRVEQERLRLALETMNAQLAQAEANRLQHPVVYALGAAVLALLGGLAWLWRRQRSRSASEAAPAMPWWETGLPTGTEAAPGGHPQPAEALPTVSTVAAAPAAAPASGGWPPAGEVDGLEVTEAGESLFREVPVATLDEESLQDLWQQVDFFTSMGRHPEAMDRLKAYATEHPRASEAPYLRWLTLAEAVGTAEDRAVAQAFYEHHFQRLAPVAALRGGAGLEDDGGYCAQLVRHWPAPEAREWLLAGLVSQPGDPASPLQHRSLQAFDDLLCLLGTLALRDGTPFEAPSPAAASAGPEPLDFDFFTWESAPEPLKHKPNGPAPEPSGPATGQKPPSAT